MIMYKKYVVLQYWGNTTIRKISLQDLDLIDF